MSGVSYVEAVDSKFDDPLAGSIGHVRCAEIGERSGREPTALRLGAPAVDGTRGLLRFGVRWSPCCHYDGRLLRQRTRMDRHGADRSGVSTPGFCAIADAKGTGVRGTARRRRGEA